MKNLFGLLGIGVIAYMVYTYHTPVTGNLIPSIEKGILNTTSIINNISSNLITELPDITTGITNNSNKQIFSKCSQPINYRIGEFANEFGVSEEYFLDSIKQAEKIWEDASGKNLFEYNESKPDLDINLVYDYRQETMTELKDLGIEVKKSRESYNEVKAKYDSAKSTYLRYKISYESSVLSFNTRAKTFESQVAYWNGNGGAPEDKYKELVKEKIFLEKELVRLSTAQAELAKIVNQVNGLANTLNKLAEILNLNVNKYNSVGSELGDSYEEGLYTQNETGQFIDIFEFQSKDQLIRILAHEMGHALGIGHLENEESIMHAISLSKNLAPTNEDLSALAGICGLTVTN